MFRVKLHLRAGNAPVMRTMKAGVTGATYVRIRPTWSGPNSPPGRLARSWKAPAMPEATPPVAQLAWVSHRYGTATALDDVTLDICAGRMVGLIGPDGVGKSTLLALIAGARKMQTGTVMVLGGDMADARPPRRRLPAHRLHAAGAGQEPLPDAVGPENIDFFGRLFGQSRGRARQADRRAAAQRPGLASVSGPAGRQAFGRHEAEARPVLRADPRPRPADPRRADDRRRSAVAPAVLGADRRASARAAPA